MKDVELDTHKCHKVASAIAGDHSRLFRDDFIQLARHRGQCHWISFRLNLFLAADQNDIAANLESGARLRVHNLAVGIISS